MKTIVALVVGLFVVTSLVGPASAECTVKGWTNGLNNQPIWDCTNE
jgi:hypothetical protein